MSIHEASQEANSDLLIFDQKLIEERDYWVERLSQLTGKPTLPFDRPAAGSSSRLGVIDIKVPDDLFQRLKEVTGGGDFLLYTTLMAALKICLYKYTDNQTVVVGSPARKQEDGGTQLVNALLIIDEIDDQLSFKQFLIEVRQTLLEAYARQRYPFERLVRDLGLEAGADGARLVDMALSLDVLHGPMPDWLRPRLWLSFSRLPGSLSGSFHFDPTLLDAATATRFAAHFRNVLGDGLADPSRAVAACRLLGGEERRLILEGWNETAVEFDAGRCIHELFETQAAQRPGAEAVVFDGQRVSYGELEERSNKLARYLQRLGVGAESLVGIHLERGVEMVVALLGVLKAGGAYVPLDPEYPAERVRLMVEDARPRVVVTGRGGVAWDGVEGVREVRLAEEWGKVSKESGERMATVASGENLAYVIYTSGSTGKPKGVLIEHRGVCNAIQASVNTFGVHESSRVIQLASMSFDSSVLEIFSALASGATLYLVQREVVAAGVDLGEFLREEDISVMVLPPSLEQLPAGDYPALETVIVGGEKCSAEMAARWCMGRRFFNVYAPTESTIYSTALEFSGPLGEAPGMGRPIANMQTYVLDRQMQPVPIGVAGEIYIGGVGVARGYFNLPGLTAEKFVPNPFGREPGSRLYRTGDLALQHADGNLEFIGRLDSQVKVRGYRIELGDIEAALMTHPAVRYAVVIVREDEAGEKMLVAYLVGDREEVPTVTRLRGYLKEKLPEYMIPTAFIVLDALPLTTHNKIDYRALPVPDSSRPALEEAFVAPRTATEQVLVDIWSEILGTKQIGVHDNFFDLGGRSLTATQLMSRISKALHVELALQNIFDAPTVATLAEVVERTRLETGGAPISRVPREPLMPLSFAQQRIWFLHQMVPPEVYNGPIAAHVVGPLDAAALEGSLNEIVRRHEVLRTSFVAEAGRPSQVIAPSLKLTVRLVDLRHQPEPVLEAQALADEEAKRPFDLAAAPLLRATILRVGDEEHVLLLTIHHIIFDGWSLGVFLRELDALYQAFTAGQPSPLAELPIQYADYAVWQRQWLQGELLEKQISYWKTKLAELPELELPTDRPRSDVPTFRGEVEPFLLPPALADRLKTLSRQEGATLFMTLLSGFKALLHRYTSQEDIVVSAPVANRNRTEIEGLIGFFVNSQVLRTDLSGNPTFRELVARVRQVTLEAHSHQDVPFELIVDELRPEGYSTSHNPLFRAAFSLQNTPAPIDYLPGLKVSPFTHRNHTSKFDLIVTLLDTDEGLSGMVQYNVDLFDHATVTGVMRNYETLLEEVSKNPDLCLLDVPLESGDATQHTSAPSLVNSRYQIESFDF